MAPATGKWTLLLLLLLTVLPLARAWEQEDYDIFDLNDALTSQAGEQHNFYSIFNVDPKATPAQISKAYRKTSVQLHPDKNPDDPNAEKLYSTLTAIATLLKDPVARERYDGHLARGIPRWRGAGYFYNRYSPGVPMVLFLVIVAISFVQYVTAWINYFGVRARVDEAKASVNNLTYNQVKKQLKKMGVEKVNKQTFKKGTPLELLQQASGEPGAIVEEAVKPRFTDLLVCKLPVLIVRAVLHAPAMLKGRKSDPDAEGSNLGEDVAEDVKDVEPVKKRGRRKKLVDSDADSSQSDALAGGIRNRKGRAAHTASEGTPAGSEGTPAGSDVNSGGEVWEEEGREIKEGEWQLDELKRLAQLTKTHPTGETGRWVRIAKALNRQVDDVAAKARELAENPRLVLQS
ncbi:hypothetical protein HK104_004417 [Borealophlyctis nickersoniae]|nr:hypothetical protein HK104_004417 [Borealophlyctis nickersoniae]